MPNSSLKSTPKTTSHFPSISSEDAGPGLSSPVAGATQARGNAAVQDLLRGTAEIPDPLLPVYLVDGAGQRTSETPVGWAPRSSLSAAQLQAVSEEAERHTAKQWGSMAEPASSPMSGGEEAETAIGAADAKGAGARMVEGAPVGPRQMPTEVYAALGVADDVDLEHTGAADLAARMQKAGVPPETVLKVLERSGRTATTKALRELLDAPMRFLPGPKGEVKIPAEHQIYEQLAHHYAYMDARSLNNLSADNEAALEYWGYGPPRVINEPKTGFQAVLFLPCPGSTRKPVLAFRGTADLGGIRTDLDPDFIGQHQYFSNRSGIEGLLERAEKQAGQKVVVTGHSLGGSLAQKTATDFGDQVGEVVTFQSPGLRKHDVDEWQKRHGPGSADPTPVTHYTAREDAVHLVGDQHLDGRVVEVNTGDDDPLFAQDAVGGILDAHRSTLLPTDTLPLPDDLRKREAGFRPGKELTAQEHLTHPLQRTGGRAEALRDQARTAIAGAAGAVGRAAAGPVGGVVAEGLTEDALENEGGTWSEDDHQAILDRVDARERRAAPPKEYNIPGGKDRR